MTDGNDAMFFGWLLLAVFIWITALALDSIQVEEDLEECEKICDTCNEEVSDE